MPDTDLVIVHTLDSQLAADLANGALEAAEIDAIIQADTAGGMRPHIAGAAADSNCSSAKKTPMTDARC